MINMLKDSTLILNNAIKNKEISFVFLFFSLLTLPLSINLSSIFLVASVLLRLGEVLIKKKNFFINPFLRTSALIGALFFLYIIINSLIQAGVTLTIKYFETEYSKFALLFVVPFLLNNKKQNKILLYGLMISTFVSVLISVFYAIIQNTIFGAHIFAHLFDIHHTYLALFILITINWATSKFSKQETKLLIKFLIVILILFYAYVLYAIESKISVLILTLLIVYHFFWKSSLNKTIKISSLVLILGFLMLFNSKIRVGYEQALDFRLKLWDAAITNINSHLLFGNMLYPEKTLLNYQHYLTGNYSLLDSNLNTHNQYLSLLLRFGILGFFLFTSLFILLAKPSLLSIKDKNISEAMGFLIIVTLVFYTENILDRHHGIVWFSVFFNYYLLSVNNE
jgi:O-antigen ligase